MLPVAPPFGRADVHGFSSSLRMYYAPGTKKHTGSTIQGQSRVLFPCWTWSRHSTKYQFFYSAADELPVRGWERVQWRTPILSPRQRGKFEIIEIDESNYITMIMSKSPQKLILRMKLDEKSWKKLFWAYELHQTLIIFISLITNIWISRPAGVTGWRPWWRCPWWCWWQCWIGDWTHFPSLTVLPNSN